MDHIAWMAWTPATAIFYGFIATSLMVLTVMALRRPETDRVGVLRMATTRGDRFFISLLGSAFIHLIFLGVFGADTLATVGDGIEISRLWIATALSFLYALCVFRWA